MTTRPEEPLLVVDRLRTVFRLAGGTEAAAVNDVSFTIERGQTLGLVGESGSGKSVTALSIVRLLPPTARIAGGRVILDGRDLVAATDSFMRSVRGRTIGFVFQEPMAALDPVYTVGAQIVETLQAHGVSRGAAARRRAVELLEQVRVPEPARRAREYPHQLSGGLRQRAMIAIALAAGPALLIADEPTTALDVTVQAEILDLLRELRRQLDLSILLITHDLGVVAEMADRVAVMYGGRIVEQGTAAEVLTNAQHPYTRALVGTIEDAEPGTRPRAIAGNVPGLGRLPAGCAFAPRCPDRFDPCEGAPSLVTTSAGHDVRCFLYPGGGA